MIFIALLIFATCLLGCSKNGKQEKFISDIDTNLVLITQVRQCSRLYTAECEVHKIITHDDELHLKGSVLKKEIDIDLPFGKRKVAIPVDATVKAYIDFSSFSNENVRRYGDKIDILLPDPQVSITQTKIRNNDIRKQVPFLRSDFTLEELSAYELEGKNAIVKSLPRLGVIKMAEEGSAKVLIPMLEQLGFKRENITISFRKDVDLSLEEKNYNITDK